MPSYIKKTSGFRYLINNRKLLVRIANNKASAKELNFAYRVLNFSFDRSSFFYASQADRDIFIKKVRLILCDRIFVDYANKEPSLSMSLLEISNDNEGLTLFFNKFSSIRMAYHLPIKKIELISRKSLAKDVTERWMIQYSDDISSGNNKNAKILRELVGLGPSPNPNDVDRIIGNDSWTHINCDGCNASVGTAVIIGSSLVCRKCLNYSLRLFIGE